MGYPSHTASATEINLHLKYPSTQRQLTNMSWQTRVHVKKYPGNVKMCAYSALEQYIACTKHLRKIKTLFIVTTGPGQLSLDIHFPDGQRALCLMQEQI